MCSLSCGAGIAAASGLDAGVWWRPCTCKVSARFDLCGGAAQRMNGVCSAISFRVLRRSSAEGCNVASSARSLSISACALTMFGNIVVQGPLGLRHRDRYGSIGASALLVRQSLAFVDRNKRYASAFVNQGNPAQQAHVPNPDPLFVRIVGTRNHVSTNGMLEFRAIPASMLPGRWTGGARLNTCWLTHQLSRKRRNASVRMRTERQSDAACCRRRSRRLFGAAERGKNGRTRDTA
ncbi:hypothetical protein C8F04DRAFT_1066853 [Mycena alexandri]|uniref:Uncharacterized protein n=1 Tax=Mycena alexandri TaxID=1745969 RepID=A0AAD6TLD2_9AGAR|nr:hypothetical protein C8F04DRAFT_1066853 [Mycena alexandri]